MGALAIIPLTIIITTYNEANNIARCLESVRDFDDVIIVDSCSTDKTVDIATIYNAQIIRYEWNGKYPKKRQWCLDNIETKHDYIFFLDADEVVTPEFIAEIKTLSFDKAGYFIKGAYIWKDRVLKYGLMNNKLTLFDKHKIEFPVIDDLDIAGMGEMEGHYQPVLKAEYAQEALGQMKNVILHYAYDDGDNWNKRHRRYAIWEAKMIERELYPKDPDPYRERLKRFFRTMPCRGLVAFFHSYFMKYGFWDGKRGFDFALSRAKYYGLVGQARKERRFKTQ